MQRLEYTIDQKEYDTLVFGTGMTEALFAASLSKIERKKILIIDADQGYSSSQKTFNFKELINDMDEKIKEQQKQKLKKNFFQTIELDKQLQENNEQFIEEVVRKTTLYKQFNIDLQPKLLFSNSLTVDCMRQANMDQYMDFRAIDAIYFFEATSKKLIQTPCSKSDIFKSKEFSLMEKKQLFQFLHKCVTLFNRNFDQKVNQNSIEEFDKEFEVDEETLALFNKLSDQPCIEFLRDRISSKKVQDIFLYNLCNFEYNPNEYIPETFKQDYTTQSFLHRLNKYIKSCGVHTALPYLYTNYGTGDIPQGYARISAIFGSTYCLNKDIEIQTIKQDTENGVFLIKSNLQRQPDEIQRQKKPENSYIYPDYSQNENTQIKQQENGNQQGESKQPEVVEQTIDQSQNKEKEIQDQENSNKANHEQQLEQKEFNENNTQSSEIQEEIKENKSEKNENTQEQNAQEKTQKQKEEKKEIQILEDNYISVKNIIAGPEYKQKLKELLGLELKEFKESMDLLRVTIIAKKSQEQLNCEEEFNRLEEEEKAKKENRYTCPILYSIPPNDLLAFKQPLSILHLDHNSMSTPESYQVFYCKKILENNNNKEVEVKKIVDFVQNIHIYKKGLPFQYTADYVWAYTQNKNDQGQFEQISKDDKKLQVSFIGQDFFEIDMDKNFEEYRNTISSISSKINNQEENYFQTVEELNGEVDFYQNKIEDDEEYTGLDRLINKFEQLKQSENQQQPQEEKKNEEKEEDKQETTENQTNTTNQTTEQTEQTQNQTENTQTEKTQTEQTQNQTE